MNTPKLRRVEAKKRFVATHTIRCVWHSTLAPGEEIRCCCGTPLGGEYFEFFYAGEGGSGILHAGPNCGESIKRESLLIGKQIDDPGYFDPYGLDAPASKPHAGGRGGEQGAVQAIPENREMIIAISLLLHCWKNEKEGPLLDERNALRKNPQRIPQDWTLRMLNRAIRNTCKHHVGVSNLRELFEHHCRKKNVRGKKFQFPILEQRLKTLNEDSAL